MWKVELRSRNGDRQGQDKNSEGAEPEKLELVDIHAETRGRDRQTVRLHLADVTPVGSAHNFNAARVGGDTKDGNTDRSHLERQYREECQHSQND